MAIAVSQEEIQRMNELYLEHKTYSAVSRIVGRAPTTVKKYIIPGYISINAVQIIPLDLNLIQENPDLSIYKSFKDMCIVSEEEWKEIEELRSEILV